MNNDFDSWCQIMNSVDIKDFLEALFQGMHFIHSICTTGFLPEPFTDKTRNFCHNTLKDIIQKMFSVACTYENPENIETFQHFYEMIIQIAIQTLNSPNSNFILLFYLFNYSDEYENNNQNLISFLKHLLYTATNQLQQTILFFSKNFPLGLEEYATFYFLILKLSADFRDDFRPMVLNNTVQQFFNSLSVQNSTSLRSVQLSILLILSNSFLNLYLNDNLEGDELFPFYNFLKESMKCDILDKQLFGAHYFINVYSNSNERCKNVLIQWFVNINFFTEVVANHPHIEVIKVLIPLFDVMSKDQLIPEDMIYDFWQQSLTAQISEREIYFIVIAHCLKGFSDQYLQQFIQTIDNIPDSGLLAHLYKTCSIEMANDNNDKILGILINLICQKLYLPVFKKVYIDLIKCQDKIITKMINQNASSWIKQPILNPVVYEIIGSLFNYSKTKLSFNGNDFLKYIIEGLDTDKQNSKILFNLLLSFINYYHICLPFDANIQIYKVSEQRYFWIFMADLLNLDQTGFNSIPEHKKLIIYFIQNEKIVEASKEYVNFMINYYMKYSALCDKSIVSTSNSYCLTYPNEYLEYLFKICGVVHNQICANTLTKFLLQLFLSSKMNFENKIKYFVQQCITILKNNDQNEGQNPQILQLLLSFIDSEEGKIDFRIFNVHRMKDSKKLRTVSILDPNGQPFKIRITSQTSFLAIRNVLSALFSISVDSIIIESNKDGQITATYKKIETEKSEIIDFHNFPVFLLSTPENTTFLSQLLSNDTVSSVAYKLLNRFIYIPLDFDKNLNQYLEFFANVDKSNPFLFKYITQRFYTLIKSNNNLEQQDVIIQCLSILMEIVLKSFFESRFLVTSLDILFDFFNKNLNSNDICKLLEDAAANPKYLIHYLRVIAKLIPNEQSIVVNVKILILLTKLTTSNEILELFSTIIEHVSSESSLYSLLIAIITNPFSFSSCEDFIESIVYKTLLKIPSCVSDITNQIIKSFDITKEKSIPIICKVLKALFAPELKNEVDLTEFVTNLLINCAFSSTDEKLQKSIFDLSMIFNDDLQDSYIMSCCSIPSYNFNPSEFMKPFRSLCGLENLGCTCYMNSILQQLSSNNDVILNLANSQEQLRSDIREMLNLFSNMRFGMNRYYSTNLYCEKYSKYNSDFDAREQEDAVEYFSMLLESCPNNVKELFQGKFKEIFSRGEIDSQTQILSEREELFTTVGVTVLGIPDLSSSLKQLLTPEKLTDDNRYLTETGEKVDALRYTRFHSLPKFIVFHLKRFEYNLCNFTRYKINSRFEFPTTLNMSEFSNVNSLYRLKGVVLHMGVAEGGHYVSVVRKERKWILCDDSNLQELDEDNFLNVAYGGENDRNAYLLFFERDERDDNEISDTSLFASLPEYLRNNIDENNTAIKKQCSLLTKSCFDYFLNRNPSIISVNYFFNALCHSNEINQVIDFSRNIENCKDYIIDSTSDLIDLIIKTNSNRIVDSLIELIGKSTDSQCIESLLAFSNRILKNSELIKKIGRIFEIAASKDNINREGFELILAFVNQILENKKAYKSVNISNYFEALIFAPSSPAFEIDSIIQMVAQIEQTDFNLLSLLRLFITRKIDDHYISDVLNNNKKFKKYKIISEITLPFTFEKAMNMIINDECVNITAKSIILEISNLVSKHSKVMKKSFNLNHQIIIDFLLNPHHQVRDEIESIVYKLYSSSEKSKNDSSRENNGPLVDEYSQSLTNDLVLYITKLPNYEQNVNDNENDENSKQHTFRFKLLSYFRVLNWFTESHEINCHISDIIIRSLAHLIKIISKKNIILNYNLLEIIKFLTIISNPESDDLVVITFKSFFNEKTMNCEPDIFVDAINHFFPFITSLHFRNNKVSEDLIESNEFLEMCKRAADFDDIDKNPTLSSLSRFVKAISNEKIDYQKRLGKLFGD